MFNRLPVKLGGRPGKYENVMSLAGLGLSECALADFFYRNDINCDLGVILLAPVPGQYIYKPLIEFGKKVGPLRDLQRFLAGTSAVGKKEERTEGGCGRCEFKEISP